MIYAHLTWCIVNRVVRLLAFYDAIVTNISYLLDTPVPNMSTHKSIRILTETVTMRTAPFHSSDTHVYVAAFHETAKPKV